MQTEQIKVLGLHLKGYCYVALHTFCASVVILWGVQIMAFVNGVSFDWAAVLEHLFLSLTLLAVFPGQTFWTYYVKDAEGRVHVIVGSYALEDGEDEPRA